VCLTCSVRYGRIYKYLLAYTTPPPPPHHHHHTPPEIVHQKPVWKVHGMTCLPPLSKAIESNVECFFFCASPLVSQQKIWKELLYVCAASLAVSNIYLVQIMSCQQSCPLQNPDFYLSMELLFAQCVRDISSDLARILAMI
jgi:hypothetical protein